MSDAESLRNFMEGILAQFPRAGFCDSKGHVFGARSDFASDFGAFGVVTQSIQTYLQLKPWEVAVTNDPFSGAPHQGELYFVMGLPYTTKIDGKEAPWCLVTALPSPFYVPQLRIPPTPMGKLGAINEDIVAAISSQFGPHVSFENAVKPAFDFFRSVQNTWNARLQLWKALPSKLTLKALGQQSFEVMEQVLSELPWGESMVEWPFENTKIRLRTEVRDGKILFDFTGTGDHSSVAVPLVTTQGTAWAALMIATKKNLWFSSDAMGTITVVAPKNTLVNSSNKTLTYPVFDAGEFVGPIFLQGLGPIWPQVRCARPGGTLGYFEVHTKTKKVFKGYIPGGAPASFRRHGEDAIPMFSRVSPLRLEITEAEFPVRFHSYGIRRDSGGSGQFEGGDGGQISIEFLEEAKVKWWILDLHERPLGEAGGLAAAPAEVFVREDLNGEKQSLPLTGEIDISPSQIWTMLGPGGGGYGAPTGA